MASYFDEHNVSTSDDATHASIDDWSVSNLLDLARLLHRLFAEGGSIELDIDNLFHQCASNPPASKEFVTSLPCCSDSFLDNCAICLGSCEATDLIKQLPKCRHHFHADCILPWLRKTNTCPVCRHEYPTDDTLYEEKRRLKEQEESRRNRVDDLHNSMFC